MLATAGPVPADDDTRYAYEWKYDGIRCLAWISDGVCHMVSRNGNSLGAAFPEISHALLSLAAGREMTLDGELVAPDRDAAVLPDRAPHGRDAAEPGTDPGAGVPVCVRSAGFRRPRRLRAAGAARGGGDRVQRRRPPGAAA
ncbi:hypothetical protein [Nocardia sp. NPDC051981]|uniref:ATP-dependent DNA ligase n=1 Tax=Nocardia sp. NPDC051981 TaxID=3155417 RepID=UPI00342F605F